MRTRKDKIQFLNGLMTGKRKLNELRPAAIHGFLTQDEKNPNLYHGKNPDVTLTRVQLDEMKRENPNSMFFIYVIPGDL